MKQLLLTPETYIYIQCICMSLLAPMGRPCMQSLKKYFKCILGFYKIDLILCCYPQLEISSCLLLNVFQFLCFYFMEFDGMSFIIIRGFLNTGQLRDRCMHTFIVVDHMFTFKYLIAFLSCYIAVLLKFNPLISSFIFKVQNTIQCHSFVN